MRSTIGQIFPVLTFTGIIESASDSGAFIQFVHVSKSGFTRTGLGALIILFPSEGPWRAVMSLAIGPEYHQPDKINAIRLAVFSALGISQSETWKMEICTPSIGEYSSDLGEGYFVLRS